MHRIRLAGTVAGLSVASMLVAGCVGASPTPSVAATPNAAVIERELVDPTDILAGAARYGDLVFTAGFLGLADGEDFDADVNDALDQLEAALGRSGAGFDTLLKVNVYLTDWDDWEAYNRIYQERIAKFGLPPRTTVEVSRLGLDSPIEIAAVAHVRPATP